MDIRESVEYKEFGFKVVVCPICGHETLNQYYICPHCNWEYDGTLLNEEYSVANSSTIEDYKKEFGYS